MSVLLLLFCLHVFSCYSVFFSPLLHLVSGNLWRHILENCKALCTLSLATLLSKLLWCLSFCYLLLLRNLEKFYKCPGKPGKDLELNYKDEWSHRQLSLVIGAVFILQNLLYAACVIVILLYSVCTFSVIATKLTWKIGTPYT